MALTNRDRAIIRLVHRYRFLRSSHIAALAGGSQQQITRRLQLLYHHGYLERPRCQLDGHRAGSRHIIYGLGSRGASVLRQGGRTVRNDWGAKNYGVGGVYFDHALLVSDVMVAIECACRQAGIRLLTQNDLAGTQFRWKVNLNGRVKLGVIPDSVFGLEYQDDGEAIQRAYFFLEADRGTMPVTRSSLSQTSMYRKFLAYETTWAHGIHHDRFRFNRFRVLTVTTGAERMQALIDACSKLSRGRGLFLFADKIVLEKSNDILSSVWRTTKGDAASLVDLSGQTKSAAPQQNCT